MTNPLIRLWKIAFQRGTVQQESCVTVLNRTRNAELGNSIIVADRGPSRRRGLLDHQNLSCGEGLWIVPCEAVHTFGMKFSIDLIYLDRFGRVMKVKTNVPPWRLSACLSAHSVMEFACGTISRTRTAPGDKLDFSFAPASNVQRRAGSVAPY